MRNRRAFHRIVAVGVASLTALVPLLGAEHDGPLPEPEPQRCPLRAPVKPARRIAVQIQANADGLDISGGKAKAAGNSAKAASGSFVEDALIECDGFLCLLGSVLALPFVAAGGAIAGASTTAGMRDIETLQSFLDDTVSSGDMQTAFLELLSANAPDGLLFEPAHADDSGDALEITLNVSNTRTPRRNPRVRWVVTTYVRLPGGSEASEPRMNRYAYQSKYRKVGFWARGDAGPLRRTLTAAYEQLVKRVVEGTVLGDTSGFRLRPLDPPTAHSSIKIDRRGRVRHKQWARTEDTRPILRWEPFSPETDESSSIAPPKRISNVTYEVRIARPEDGLPPGATYHRSGLIEPEHTPEGLHPNTEYYWTVRARFELDGECRFTRWGSIDPKADELASVPNAHSFRFKTGRARDD